MSGTLNLTGYGVDSVKVARPVKITLENSAKETLKIANFMNSNDTEEMNFNGKTNLHQALMAMIGGDKTLDINDVNNKLKTEAAKYGVTVVPDKDFKTNGKVTLQSKEGKLSIDFWTDKEIKEYQDNTQDTMSSLLGPVVNGIEKIGEVVGKAMEPMGTRFAKQVDILTERIQNWHPFD